MQAIGYNGKELVNFEKDLPAPLKEICL